jgi:hypothetical protein
MKDENIEKYVCFPTGKKEITLTRKTSNITDGLKDFPLTKNWNEEELKQQVINCLPFMEEIKDKKIKTINKKQSSYNIKHIAENFLKRLTGEHVYISKDCIEYLMIQYDFNKDDTSSENHCYNLSDINNLRD